MHENEATIHEAENEAKNYVAENEVEAVKFGLETNRGLNIPGLQCFDAVGCAAEGILPVNSSATIFPKVYF